MADHRSVTDQLLERTQADLSDYLEKNNIPEPSKRILQTLDVMLLVTMDDHQKTNEMYPVFRKTQDDKKERDYYKKIMLGTVITTLVILSINGILWFGSILPALTKLKP